MYYGALRRLIFPSIAGLKLEAGDGGEFVDDEREDEQSEGGLITHFRQADAAQRD